MLPTISSNRSAATATSSASSSRRSRRRPTERKALSGDRDLVISYGAVLGAEFSVRDGKIVAKRKVKTFPLDRWFLKEELTRDQGNIFFVHTKYLLIDPLSDDPLICTGSANFSENSLTNNDENMILIRGSTRVADIYMTEFDRLFRHFYFRDVANEVAMKRKKRQKPKKVFLDENDSWTDSYFFAGRVQDATPRNVLQRAGRQLDRERRQPPRRRTDPTAEAEAGEEGSDGEDREDGEESDDEESEGRQGQDEQSEGQQSARLQQRRLQKQEPPRRRKPRP